MDTLPSDLERLITSYLDIKSRRIMRLANTQWFDIIRYNDFIMYYTTDQQLDLLLNSLKKYLFPIGLEFVKRRCGFKKQHLEKLGQLTQLTKLCGLSFYEAREGLHPLTNLINLNKLQMESLPDNILRHFHNLTHIDIRLTSLNGNGAAQFCDPFTKLKSVNLNYTASAQEDINDPLLLIPTYLTSIDINDVPPSLDPANLTRFTNLKNFSCIGLEKQLPRLPNLESMSLSCVYNICLNLEGVQENLTSLTLYTREVHFKSLATLTKLRSLTLLCRSISQSNDMIFLSTMTELENLQLVVRDKDGGNWQETLKWINSRKLTSLDVSGAQGLHNIIHLSSTLQKLKIDFVDLDSGSMLQEFTSLTELELVKCSMSILPFISSLVNLKSLKCTTAHPGNESLRIDKLTALEELVMCNYQMEYAPIDDNSIFHLPLTRLEIKQQIKQQQKFLENIAEVTTLKILNFRSCTDITDSSIQLLTNLTNLMELTLLETSQFKAAGCSSLTLLTSLRTLAMYCTPALEVDEKLLMQRMTRLVSVNFSMVY